MSKLKRVIPVLIVVFIGFFSLIQGCSTSSVSESKYYLLNNQQPITVDESSGSANKNSLKQAAFVVVNELPRYLNQANLVMQVDQHQLHYTHHHMWAEPLHSGFSKALLSDLNKGNGTTVFLSE